MSIPATSPQAPPAPPADRPLWPAPIFVLGVGALLFVYFTRPMWPCGFGGAGCRDLEAARAQLARPDGDAELALKLATRAIQAGEDDTGEAAFLAGSAHARLAELAAPAAAAAHWRKAAQLLDQAEQAGVADDDRAALSYRLGKAALALGDAPAAVRRLEDAVPKLTSRGEGYALLVRAYLALPRPELEKALEANRLLREVPTVEISDAELTAAQLQGGELLLRLGRPAEARKSLALIRDQATRAVRVQARLLEARCFQEEKQYGDAARLYQQALADGAPTPEPARVYYALGTCYANQDQPKEAARAWEKCAELGAAPEAAAAAVRLADIRVSEGEVKAAAELLKGAVAPLRPGTDWANPLLDRAAVAEVFERAVAAARQARAPDVALDLLDPYARLAPPLRVLTLRGEARVASASFTKDPAARYRQAADDYAEAAALPGLKAKERAELLWTSAEHSQTAGDARKAAERLERLVALDAEPERLAEAWYRLGRLRAEAGDDGAAGDAYRKCMEQNTRFEYLARHQIALGLLREKPPRIDDAAAVLVQNVNALRHEAGHEALTLSLSLLADMLYKKRDYRRVVHYLENHLGALKGSPEATRARYQLADSYRQLASQQTLSLVLTESMSPETRKHHEQQHRRWLEKAADEFTALDALLDAPAGKDHLSREQRTAVPFVTAKCWFNLGQFDKALKIYEKLTTRHPGQIESLEALGGVVSCHAALLQQDPRHLDRSRMNLIKQRLNEIQQLLPTMPPEASEPWEEWVQKVARSLDEYAAEIEAGGRD